MTPFSILHVILSGVTVAFAFVCFTTHAVAQRSISPHATTQLEQALERIGMRMSDLAMPPDLLDRDRQRTAMHDSLFSQPLSAVDRLDALREAFGQRNNATMYSIKASVIHKNKKIVSLLSQNGIFF